VDILCVQETWIAEGALAPTLDGYSVVERRRTTGTRGGLATYIKKPIKIESSNNNEYGIHTKVILPNSTRLNIVNIYIPPSTSLT
jgi:exonuclease III